MAELYPEPRSEREPEEMRPDGPDPENELTNDPARDPGADRAIFSDSTPSSTPEEPSAWDPSQAASDPPPANPYPVPDPLFGERSREGISPEMARAGEPQANWAEPQSPPGPESGPVYPPPTYTSSPSGASSGEPLSPQDERTWAMLAHLSVLLNLVTGFLGPVAALIIYLVFKDRSRYAAYQSMQAFVFQLVWWVGGGILTALAWSISGALVAILIGCLLMPLALLISLAPLVALVYGVIGAIQTSQGRDFKYWLIGDLVR